MEIRYEEADYSIHNDDILTFVKPYWEETYLTQKYELEFAPGLELMSQLYEAGVMKGIVGYNESGEMVSVYLCMITPYLFSKGHLVANECLWHMREDVRSVIKMKELMKEIEKMHNKYNVGISHLSMHTDKFEPVMNRCGYALDEYWYMKRL